MDFLEIVRQPRQVLTTGFNPVQRADKNNISPFLRKSSVGTTDTNNWF